MRIIRSLTAFLIILSLIVSGCSPSASPVTPAAPATSPTLTPITTLTPAPPPTVTPPPTQVNGQLAVYFIDVGQGDSIIVRNGNYSMLIDAGTNAGTTSLINTIKAMGITRFDTVIATHPHEDHIGGMDAVINQFGVGKIYMPNVTDTTKTFTDVLTAIKNKGLAITSPIPGTVFNVGQAQCTILAPNSQTYADLNDYSIVIRLVYGNTSFLFTGDAQTDSEKEMLAKGYNLKADVLKVGHHGSSTSTSPEFLKAVSPKYAVISVGQGNTYGHPAPTTLDKLNGAGVKVYRTDLNGTVTIISDGTNLSVSGARQI